MGNGKNNITNGNEKSFSQPPPDVAMTSQFNNFPVK